MFLVMLVVSVVSAWPSYMGKLMRYYTEGPLDLSVIIMSAVVVFLIGYFILCVYQVISTKRMKSKRYIIVCIISMTMPFVPIGLLLGLPDLIFGVALQGVVMSTFPAFILCFVEHLATKELRGDKEWFITKISRLVSRVFIIGHSTGMIVFGVLVLIFSAVYSSAFDAVAAPSGSMPGPMACAAMGILFIVMGRFAKKSEAGTAKK